ncbi:lasso RiPP family leader peptide-containing protein [Kitasatospora sp. NPDC056273]
MDIVIKDTAEYVTPALDELGTVVEVTLGSAGNNNADDTQYWS